MTEPAAPLLDRRDPERGTGVRVPSTWERHLQSVLVTVIGGLILWVGSSVADLGRSAERLAVQMDAMQVDSQAMQQRLASSYLAADARRDLEIRDQAIIRLEERVRALERQISSLEARTQPGQLPPPQAPAPPVLPAPTVPTVPEGSST